MGPFERILQRLSEYQVKYVTVGGYASMLYGCELMTKDVDVACEMSPANLINLGKALADLNPVHRQTPQKLPLDLETLGNRPWKNLYLRISWGQLDCLGEVAGIGDFDAVWARSEELDLGDFKIRILSLDALIEAKKAIGRPRDIHAVHELEAIRELRKQNRPSS
jgi:hypothetical protein